MTRGCIALSMGLLLLAGCRTHPEIPVSDEQSLVMESTILLHFPQLMQVLR